MSTPVPAERERADHVESFEPVAPPAARASRALDEAFLTGVEGTTELFLVRHGEQLLEATPTGILVGDIRDPPLSARGVAQAAAVGARFSTVALDAVYASPLRRAFDTGEQIARHHGLVPIVESDLREVELFRDLPDEVTLLDSIGRRALTGMRNRMQREKVWDVYSHSEPSTEFRRRVVNSIEGILDECAGKRVVVACHGGVICTYIGWMLGIRTDMWFRAAHTSVQLVRAKDAVRIVESLGDTTHLRGPDGDLTSY